MAFAEECALELHVGARERGVVPVEAAAQLGRAHQQWEQDAAEEGLVLVGARPRVCAREDGGGRRALELLHGKLSVRSPA